MRLLRPSVVLRPPPKDLSSVGTPGRSFALLRMTKRVLRDWLRYFQAVQADGVVVHDLLDDGRRQVPDLLAHQLPRMRPGRSRVGKVSGPHAVLLPRLPPFERVASHLVFDART